MIILLSIDDQLVQSDSICLSFCDQNLVIISPDSLMIILLSNDDNHRENSLPRLTLGLVLVSLLATPIMCLQVLFTCLRGEIFLTEIPLVHHKYTKVDRCDSIS